MAKITLDELVDIAFAHEEGDPFDWGIFSKGQEQTMRMMLATITKLVTENMILHTKLIKQNEM